MKLVANKSFANNTKPPIELDWYVKGADGKPLKNHIHKGARFAIGTADEFDNLTPDEKITVSQLMVSYSVVAASDAAAVAKIDAEIAEDKARDKRDRQRVWREQHRWTFDRRLVLYGILIAIIGIIAYLVLR
jgi:hypothetical protein